MAKPYQIFLVRHGLSEGNVDQSTHERVPDYKIDLTEQGYSQALYAGAQLHSEIGGTEFDKVAFYVSPYVRTRQTLRGILEHFHPKQVDRVREDPRLREQEWGHLRCAEVTNQVDKERQAYGTFFYRIPDGESGADVYDRCTGFLDTLYRDFKKDNFPDNVCIVTHGFTMRVLLMRWLHWTVEEFHELANPANCSIFRLQLQESGKYNLSTPFPKRADRKPTN